MACPRCGCRMPARSIHGLVCADCGTPLNAPAERPVSWTSLTALACACLLTTGAFVLSSLSSESPSLAEVHAEKVASASAAGE